MAEKHSMPRPTLADMTRRAFGLDASSENSTDFQIHKVGARGLTETKLDIQIQRLLASSDTARLGQLNIIGLEKVSDPFGEKWNRVAPKGMQIAEGVLRTHLTQTDIAVSLGNLGYLILFKNLTRNEADIKAAMIAAEIANRLLGGIQEADDVSIVSVNETPEGDILLEEKTLLDVVTTQASEQVDKLQNDVSERDATGPKWKDAAHTKRKQENPPARPSQSPEFKPSLEDIQFVYKPLWDVRRKVLSTYWCQPVAKNALGNPVFGYDIYAECGANNDYPELDLLTLKAASQTLEDLHGRGRRVLLATPVHSQTLLSMKEFTKFRQFCQSMDDDLLRDLIFELQGVTDVSAHRNVLELVSALKSLGRAVVLPVNLNRTHFEELRSRGFDTVAADVSAFEGDEVQLMKLMDTFVAGASHAGLRTVAHSIQTINLATLAVAAGFDYVEGEAVHETVDHPEHVFRYKSDDLFAKLMG